MSRWSPARTARRTARRIGLGVLVGVVSGLAVSAFLEGLSWATRTRLAHSWLLWILPVAGLTMGAIYHHFAGDARHGNALIIDEIHAPRAWVPRRMAPFVLVAAVSTHLFGGSAGREGVAIQMAGSLSDAMARILRLDRDDRRLVLVTAVAGAFGGAFGTPVAGAVFALEVQARGHRRYGAFVPALAASFIGTRIVRGFGLHEDVLSTRPDFDVSALLVVKVALAGLACGILAAAFVGLTHRIQKVLGHLLHYPPLRLAIGGLAIIALTGIVGTREYLGASTDLVETSLAGGVGIATFGFAWKLLFTATTLGSGFQGGEVTPLFVTGATAGVTLGHWLHAPIPLFAMLGYVAVFAGAANTPIACVVMGVEVFGAGLAPWFIIICAASVLTSAERGLFHSHRLHQSAP